MWLVTRGLGSGFLITRGLGAPSSSGYTPPTAPDDVPLDLVAAIQYYATNDTNLGGVTGGWWKDEVPPPIPTIYGIVTMPSSSLLWNTGDSLWASNTVAMRVVATEAATAQTIGAILIRTVPGWGALTYFNGFSIPFVEAGTKSGRVKSRRPGDPGSWFFEISFTARCQRGS